jgi:hypothetical protein
MASVAACDTDVDSGGVSSEATVCTVFGQSWANQPFADQTGNFRVEFAVTPSNNNIDATIGLSNGPATTWTKLAAIVRFAPSGYIDARHGGLYAAMQNVPYFAGVTYYIRIDVDVRQHRYYAWASHQEGVFGSWNQIASGYAFRTEQASVTKLNTLAGYVNTTTGGSVQLCDFTLGTPPWTGNGCIAANPGGGFVNVATTPATNTMVVDLVATPSIENMDGVIGVSSGAADAYNDLAAGIRFYTNGRIEARDGDTYRADAPVGYRVGQHFQVKLAIDLANHTYSVFVRELYGSDPGVELAKGYRFRTQQQAVSRLDHVATIVASSTGRVDTCHSQNLAPANLRYLHEGRYSLAPVGTGVLVSDATSTKKLDANGKILGSVPVGGSVAAEASGDFYVARKVGSTTLTVDAFSSTLAPRWSSSIDIGDAYCCEKISVAQGRVLVPYVGGTIGTVVEAFATSDGTPSVAGAHPINDGTTVGTGEGFAFATRGQTSYQLETFNPDGSRRWTKTIDGDFWISALAIAPDGAVVFGGEFFGDSINFGDQILYPDGEGNDGPNKSFFVALSPAGDVRYSKTTGGRRAGYIDATAGQIAVSTFRNEAATYSIALVSFGVFDTAGNSLAGCTGCDVGLGDQGYAAEVALAPSRVYVNVVQNVFFTPDFVTFPFLYAFDF